MSPRLTVSVSERRDHLRGSPYAPVTLLEYGDYECPYCGAVYPIIEELRATMGDAMRFAYRHFPLATAHPHAQSAAAAAEAAGGQEQFWAMHDTLFTRQEALEEEDLVFYAEELGLDVERFAYELDAGIYVPRIREDFSWGVRSGVNGTPTFYINDLRYDGSYDRHSLLVALQEAGAGAGASAER
jgi:protein-disulfide isomerase